MTKKLINFSLPCALDEYIAVELTEDRLEAVALRSRHLNRLHNNKMFLDFFYIYEPFFSPTSTNIFYFIVI